MKHDSQKQQSLQKIHQNQTEAQLNDIIKEITLEIEADVK
jgi:hypothetical protein